MLHSFAMNISQIYSKIHNKCFIYKCNSIIIFSEKGRLKSQENPFFFLEAGKTIIRGWKRVVHDSPSSKRSLIIILNQYNNIILFGTSSILGEWRKRTLSVYVSWVFRLDRGDSLQLQRSNSLSRRKSLIWTLKDIEDLDQHCQTLWPQDSFKILFKIIEDPKKFLLMWVISLCIYHIKVKKIKNEYPLIYFKINYMLT